MRKPLEKQGNPASKPGFRKCLRWDRDLPTKEGGYVRTGSRTPMQWQSLASLNASYATPAITGGNYLPVDPSPDAPNVADSQSNKASLWYTVRRMLHLRGNCEPLQSGASFHPISRRRLFAFERSTDLERVIVAVNPSTNSERLQLPHGHYRKIFEIGETKVDFNTLTLGMQSFAILKATA